MGVVRTGESEYEKELQKWDTPKRLGGFGPDGFEPFPCMVYKAYRRENGKVMCMDMDALYSPDMNTALKADAFNRSCQLTVNSQSELDRAMADGWRKSPQDALDHFESLQRDIAQAAAEAAYSVQRMSAKAQAEHKAADAATDAPITDVQPAPKKRGRKPNQPMVTVS